MNILRPAMKWCLAKPAKRRMAIGYFFSGSATTGSSPVYPFLCFHVIDVQGAAILSDPSQFKWSRQKERKRRSPRKQDAALSLSKGNVLWVVRKAARIRKSEKPKLSPELLRIQPVLQAFLAVLAGVLSIPYLVHGWSFWKLSQRLDGVANRSALRFQTALGCCSV